MKILKTFDRKGLKIVNYDEKGEIYITGIVIDDTDAEWLRRGDDGVIGYTYPAAVKAELDALAGKPIDVHIASDGGTVAAGIAIFNMLKNHDAPVVAYIDAWAASIASMIAFAANKIMMPANTFLMIHNPSGCAFGEASYLRAVADWLDKLQEMIAQTYKSHANADVTIERIHELMDAETWLTAKEAAEMFDNVELLEKDTDLDAVACLSCEKSAPEAVSALARMRKEADEAAKMVADIKKVLTEAYKV